MKLDKVVTALIATCVSAGCALDYGTATQSINNGVPDGDGHPYVGVLWLDFGFGPEPMCSGFLISSSVFLSAGHCLEGVPPEITYVSFNPSIFETTPEELFQATGVHVHPEFGGDSSDPGDMGVVILPDTGIAPANLPSANLLGDLKAAGTLDGTSFTNVGYGFQSFFNPPSGEFDGLRRVSSSPFQALTQDELILNANTDATGEGGACFGDSGGPKLLPNSDTAVASQKGGDARCRAVNDAMRLDTASARGFLGEFVALP